MHLTPGLKVVCWYRSANCTIPAQLYLLNKRGRRSSAIVGGLVMSVFRATASSLAQSSNWLANLAVALAIPLFLSRSPSGPHFMFGACL
ncbi:hypothetical protein BDV93DRAFT_519186, partial [Ceratobasidium sp. AG-I]